MNSTVCEVNMPGYAPLAAEGIFVQLLLSGTEIIGMRQVNFGFWYALSLRRGVGVCGLWVGRKSKFFHIFTPTPTSAADVRDLSVLCNPGREAWVWKVCLRSVAEVWERWPVNKKEKNRDVSGDHSLKRWRSTNKRPVSTTKTTATCVIIIGQFDV